MSVKSLYDGQSTNFNEGMLFTDRRDFYIDPQVVKELWTDVAPFTTVISNRETRATNDPIFKMFEHRNPWVKQSFTLGTLGSDVTIDVNDTGVEFNEASMPIASCVGIEGAGATPDNMDSWIGLECEVWDDSTQPVRKGVVVIVKKADGKLYLKNIGDSSFDMKSDYVLEVIGNAHGEGTVAPDAWSDELELVWNSTQIFKTPLEITGTLLQASLRGESSELARLRAQKNQEHKMQKEKAFLFGTRVGDMGGGSSAAAFADNGATDGGGKKIRTTQGIISSLLDHGNASASSDEQNVFVNDPDSYAYGDFIAQMEKVFQYVPEVGVKRVFCGAGFLSYWSSLDATSGASSLAGQSGWTVNVGDMKRDTLGFNYRMLETPHGMLQLIPTPALRGKYNKTGLIVSEENLFHAQYRSPMFQANIKTEDAYDGVKDQYFSDEGIGLSLLESHALMQFLDPS